VHLFCFEELKISDNLIFILPLHLDFVLLLAPKLFLRYRTCYIKFSLACFWALLAYGAQAQYKVKGTVYDSSRLYRIESVTVLSTNGRGTATDSLGRYQLEVGEKDSVWFSFLGKSTPRYPVLKIPDINRFDIALRLKADVLPEVKIRSRIYKEDSLQNRKDYAKAFDFRRPNFGSLTSVNAMGAGIDIQELIRLFQFRKNKSMEKFRERLLEQEREKFVDHKFNKALAKRLTGLDGNELAAFMRQYRPSYEFALFSSDYDFQLYIKNAGEEFKKAKSF
jgi:hypothetical protein